MNLSRRAADYDPAGARRWVQFTLGLLWLADGLLQLQPFMFTRAFATQVLAPTATGNPGFVAGPVLAVARIVGHEPAAFNALFASIQLAIGLGLLWRRTVRAALVASIIWGLLVWSSGEGFGGILTSNPTPVTGAPGAAVLYVLISALTWPPGRCPRGGGPLGDWARPAWLAVWGSGAYFLLLAANQAPRALGSSLADAATGEPGWLAALDNGAAVAVEAPGRGGVARPGGGLRRDRPRRLHRCPGPSRAAAGDGHRRGHLATGAGPGRDPHRPGNRPEHGAAIGPAGRGLLAAGRVASPAVVRGTGMAGQSPGGGQRAQRAHPAGPAPRQPPRDAAGELHPAGSAGELSTSGSPRELPRDPAGALSPGEPATTAESGRP